MYWFGVFSPINKLEGTIWSLQQGSVGPVQIMKTVYGFVPGHDAGPYWAYQVQGEVTATRWSASAKLKAAAQAHLIASLISLAYEPGTRIVVGPWEAPDRAYSCFKMCRPKNRPRMLLGACSVVGNSWAKLHESDGGKRKLLESALATFQEGLSLQENHPSMALVAFVAAIEAVGQIDNPPDPPCPRCGVLKGAHRAFKGALKRANFPRKWLQIADKIYGEFRSSTVHSAVLHGHEPTAGIQTIELNDSSSYERAVAFTAGVGIGDVGQLWFMRQACKRALLSYLL